MATYVNNLRLTEYAPGDADGSWGTPTTENMEFIADAFGYDTEQFAADSNETFTMADGAADPLRAMYLKVTSAGSLTSTRTFTIAPNTVSKVWIIENATTGSQSITISQGSGGTVTIGAGQTKAVYTDGAGAGAAVVDIGLLTTTSPVLTTPQINDTTADHQYVFAVSELAADRTVTLPLLTGADTFVFQAHAQTLTNKTIAVGSNTLTGSAHGTVGFDDAGAMVQRYVSGGAQWHTADVIEAVVAKTAGMNVCALTSTKAFAVYLRNSDGYMMGVVIDKSGDTVTAGTPEVMVSSACNYATVTALTSTKVAIAYTDSTNTDLRAVIVTITGSDPDAPGTPVALDTTEPRSGGIAICAVSSTVAAVSYVDDATSDASIVMFSVSGTTITAGTPLDFAGTESHAIGVMFHDTDKITGVYVSGGASPYPWRWKCSFSGLVLSSVENEVLSAWSTLYADDTCAFAGPFGDTAVVMGAYTNTAQDIAATMFIGGKTAEPTETVSPQMFANTFNTSGPYIGCKIDSTHAVFMMREDATKIIYQVTVDADGLLTVTNATPLNNQGQCGGMCYMETGQCMYVYADNTNSDYPTARLLEIPQ